MTTNQHQQLNHLSKQTEAVIQLAANKMSLLYNQSIYIRSLQLKHTHNIYSTQRYKTQTNSSCAANIPWNKKKTCITRNTFCGTWYLPHSRVHKSIAELCRNFGDSSINMVQIAYFSLRMRKTALFLLPVKNLTSPSCSPTPISYNTREFWRYVNI